jgi:predicted nucleic acid-binding protein
LIIAGFYITLLVGPNSVVCGWLLENQANAYTDAVAARLGADRATAPSLLHLEYANVLRTACRRGILTAQRAQEAIRQLQQLPIDTDNGRPDPSQWLALTLRHDLTVYDATYLELALRRQWPIATQDAALADAARVAGVGVLTP